MTTKGDTVTDLRRDEVEPTREPPAEVSDPHMMPLDDDDDARFLDPADPRRRRVEAALGHSFNEEVDIDDGTINHRASAEWNAGRKE